MFELDIQHIRNSLSGLTQELTKEYYLFTSGIKTELSINEIYSKYSFLLSERILDFIRMKLKVKNVENYERRKLKYLLEALYAEVYANRVKHLREKLSVLESTGMIEIAGGKKIKFINSINHLYNNDSRYQREKISEARCKFIEENLNPVLIEEFEAENNFIQNIGYSNKIQMFDELSGINLYELNEQMKVFLNKTESVFVDLLAKFAKNKIGININELYRHDVFYMMRGNEFDIIFPSDKIFETASAFCRKIGIDLNTKRRIIFDTEPRETKSARAFCAPVSVPDEIYLVINPNGGVNDFYAFLHEMGHALHYSYVLNNLEIEYKYFGDNSVSEGFAMFFDHLLADVNWLTCFTNLKAKMLTEYLEYSKLKELLMLRRYAAKLEYELRLNEVNEIPEKSKMYSDIFKKTTKINYNEEDFLTDVDPYFYCARYLRAWMFQASLKKHFCISFGNDWFLKKDSGKFLKEIWSSGQKYSAEELLKFNNCGTMSVSLLLDNIETMLNKS